MANGIDMLCLGDYYYTKKGCPGYTAPVPVQTPAVSPPDASQDSGANTGTPPDGSGISFTESSYGNTIPILFGSDLLGGNVIWSSNFKLNQFSTPAGIQYYWTCSFAMALCEGPIDALLRIYVGDLIVLDNVTATNPDGTVIKNNQGAVNNVAVDFTTPDSPLRQLPDQTRQTRITLFNGDGTQIPKSIMSETEGYDLSPGYRGIGFILFENLVVGDSIPQITVEVSANVKSLMPRQYGVIPGAASGGGATTRNGTTDLLMYDPAYDVFYTTSLDSGTGTYAVNIFDGNTLDFIHQSFLLDPLFLTRPSPLPDERFAADALRSLLLPSIGAIWCISGSLGGGEYYVFNPWSGAVLSVLRTPSTLGHHRDIGPANSHLGGHVTSAFASDGITLQDCLPMFDFGGGITQGFGFTNVDKNGIAIWHDHAPASSGDAPHDAFVVNGGGDRSSITWTPTAAQLAKNSTFPVDGADLAGSHVYIFSTDAATTSRLGIHIQRISTDPPHSVDAPLYADADVAFISNASLSGFGAVPLFGTMWIDPYDNTIVMGLDNDTGDTQATAPLWFVKFDPITTAIVWKTPVNSALGGAPSHMADNNRPNITGQKFAWHDAVAIWSIDTKTGTVTKEATFSDEDLPPSAGDQHPQFYNGMEDSLTYLTDHGNTSQTLVKVFIGRRNRAQVPLEDIIVDLLKRCDWNLSDIILDDISTIALDGYTVTDVEAIREVFSDLQQVFTFDIVESNGRILYKSRGESPTVTIAETQLGVGNDSDGNPWLVETHDYDFANTRKLNLTYRDIDMQYKTNVQSVMLPKYNTVIVDADAPIDVEVNIVMDEDAAKQLAEILLYAKVTYETAFDGGAGQQFMYLDPSDVVTFKFDPKDSLDDVTLRMRTVSIGDDKTVTFNATREDPDIYVDQVDLFGTLGRYVAPLIPPVQPRIDAFLLPIPGRSNFEVGANDAGPLLYPILMTFLNTRPTAIPSQAILVYLDGDKTNPIAITDFPNFPTWGYAIDVLKPWPQFYATDFKGTLDVQLLSAAGASFASISYETMITNITANLCLVGGELCQFMTATDMGNNLWRFGGFRRCLQDTETANIHVPGEKFIMLGSADGLLDTSIVTVKALLNVGPDKGVTVVIPSTNPLQPVTGQIYTSLEYRPRQPGAGGIVNAAGDAVLTWNYCARYNAEWTDSGDEANDVVFQDFNGTPTFPTYLVYLTSDLVNFDASNAATYLRKVEVDNALTFTYTAAMQTADGFDWTSQTLGAAVVETNSKTGFDMSTEAKFYRGNIGRG